MSLANLRYTGVRPGDVRRILLHSDRVVGKAQLGIAVRGPLVQLNARPHVPHFNLQISHLVEQPEFVVEFGRSLEFLDDLGVEVDGLIELILLLEFAGLVLCLVDVQSAPLGFGRTTKKPGICALD